MTTPSVLEPNDAAVRVPEPLAFGDLVALLAPIRDDAPAGDPLRYDPDYDRMREARREDDSTLPQGIWTRDLKRADWKEVDRVGTALIATRGKDLQVAAWLLEAWIHLYGFAGVRRGFELLYSLCDTYWETLHPLPDGSDAGARTATLEWVNQRLTVPLAAIAVTAPTDRRIRPWTWTQREIVLRHENDRRRAGPKGGAAPSDPDGHDKEFTSAAFGVSAEVTPRIFFASSVDDLTAAIASASALSRLLDDRCGADAPSLEKFIRIMTAIRDWMTPMAVSPHAGLAQGQSPIDDVAPAPDVVAEPMEAPNMDPTTDASAASPVDHARARAEAYRKLADAAHTLMRLEPHSPTPYLVRRAIAWGGMSLAELMRHFIESGYDLRSLYSMLGMDEGEQK